MSGLKLSSVSDTEAVFAWLMPPTSDEEITTILSPNDGHVSTKDDRSGYKLTGLKPYTEYTFIVSVGSRQYTYEFTTELSPPVLSDEASNDYVTLRWTTVHTGSSTEFELKYRINDGKYETVKKDCFSHKIDNLKLGDKIEAKIRVFYRKSSSEWSSLYYAKTIVPVPGGFNVHNRDLGEIITSWNPVLKEMGSTYKITLCEVGFLYDSNQKYYSTSDTKALITDLKCGKTYRVKVKAVVERYESEWSNGKEIETNKPSPPKNIVFVEITDSAIDMKWDNIENNGISYEVQYWKKSFFSFMDKGETVQTDENKATICGLESSTTYQVRVRSVFGEYKSDWSETQNIETTKVIPFKRPKLN